MSETREENMTLENLAGMVQRGFLGVDKRFDEVDKRFDLLEREMNARFDQLEKIMFHEYKDRIERLEDEVKELQADFRQLVGFKK
jgi:archaellum component FlaC